MIVLEDYTEMNGATRIVKGSHKWGSDRAALDEEAITVTCPAGSIVYFLGSVPPNVEWKAKLTIVTERLGILVERIGHKSRDMRQQSNIVNRTSGLWRT